MASDLSNLQIQSFRLSASCENCFPPELSECSHLQKSTLQKLLSPLSQWGMYSAATSNFKIEPPMKSDGIAILHLLSRDLAGAHRTSIKCSPPVSFEMIFQLKRKNMFENPVELFSKFCHFADWMHLRFVEHWRQLEVRHSVLQNQGVCLNTKFLEVWSVWRLDQWLWELQLEWTDQNDPLSAKTAWFNGSSSSSSVERPNETQPLWPNSLCR